MKIRALIAACMAAVLVMPPTGYAAYRVGDFEITPHASLSERFDDNITSASNDTVDDLITELALGVNIKLDGNDQVLNFDGVVTQELFAEETGYNNTTERLSLDYSKELSKLDQITVGDSFTRAEVPTNFNDEFGRTPGRYRYSLNRFNMDYQREFSKQVTLTAGYANEMYERAEGGADSMAHTLNVGGNYSISSATILMMRYGFTVREFDPGGDATAHMIDAGVRQYITKQLYAEAFAGVSFIDPVTGKDLTKPRYSISIVDELDENSSVRLRYSKRSETNFSDDDVFESWRVSLDFEHRFYNRFAMVAGFFFYGEGEYAQQNISDKFTGSHVRAEYDVSESVTAFAEFSNSKTDSSQDTRDYQKNVVTFGVRIKF